MTSFATMECDPELSRAMKWTASQSYEERFHMVDHYPTKKELEDVIQFITRLSEKCHCKAEANVPSTPDLTSASAASTSASVSTPPASLFGFLPALSASVYLDVLRSTLTKSYGKPGPRKDVEVWEEGEITNIIESYGFFCDEFAEAGSEGDSDTWSALTRIFSLVFLLVELFESDAQRIADGMTKVLNVVVGMMKYPPNPPLKIELRYPIVGWMGKHHVSPVEYENEYIRSLTDYIMVLSVGAQTTAKTCGCEKGTRHEYGYQPPEVVEGQYKFSYYTTKDDVTDVCAPEGTITGESFDTCWKQAQSLHVTYLEPINCKCGHYDGGNFLIKMM
jgi:hypothetical protein